jgi:hypothetical protein
MNQEDLERMLSSEENIVCSSGFVANVMDAVERAASTPAPIPFPWKYVIPGLMASLIALVSFVSLAFGNFNVSSTGPAIPTLAPIPAGLVESLKAFDAAWIAVALLVSATSVIFSMRIARGQV